MKEAIEKSRGSVLAAAAKEAAALRAGAREELTRELAKVLSEEKAKLKARLAAAEAALAELSRRALSQARREGRLQVLQTRNQAIAEIFDRVRGEILALPAEKHRDVLRIWLAACDPAAGGEVLPAARDREILRGLVEEMNAARPASSRLALSVRDAPGATGFILKTETYEINRSLEDWLAEKKRDLAPRLFQELCDASASQSSQNNLIEPPLESERSARNGR